MNERIKELAVQAQQYAEYITPQGCEWFDTFKEKFAELIVRECAKCMTTPQIQAKLPDDVVMKTVLDVLVSDMKQHFGVEE